MTLFIPSEKLLVIGEVNIPNRVYLYKQVNKSGNLDLCDFSYGIFVVKMLL